jgi:hypothetical protein
LWRATAVSTNVGFWSRQAESRTDFAMLMALLFIIVAGLARSRSTHASPSVDCDGYCVPQR